MAERTITCLVQPPWKARTRPLSARKDLKERKRVEKRGRQREGAKETEREGGSEEEAELLHFACACWVCYREVNVRCTET